MSRSVPLKMRKPFHTTVVQEIKTHILCSLIFSRKSYFYEKMWKYIVELGRPQVTIWLMPFECWKPKATNTHSGCVILIAFPVQRLHERASNLRYTGVLISPQPDLLPDVFYLMERIFRLMLVLLYRVARKMYTLFTHQYLWNKFKLNRNFI